MDEKQKEELRELIEGEAFRHYENQMAAKEAIDDIARTRIGKFYITPAQFKKLVKLNYDKSIEAERRKFIEINDLYIDLFEPAGTPGIDKIDSWQDQTPYQAGEIVERFNDEIKSLDDELLKNETLDIKNG